ncbi:MAG TPA: hypothetical protein VGB21_02825 [Candidatus Methylomirabilis sp.]
MLSKRGFFLFQIFALGLALSLGSAISATAAQGESATETWLSINGYEGTLQNLEPPAALLAIKELKIGDPPFLKELEATDLYGITSSQGGALRKGAALVQVFKLQLSSEDQASSILNLKCKQSTHRAPLAAEDPTNCRTPDFGLFFDGTNWSGFRREKAVLVLMKGAVSQEEFFRIMEKVI